jgi:hypothetical protein
MRWWILLSVIHVCARGRGLGDLRPGDLTTPKIEQYTQQRLVSGRARATVNRELETLRQALTLASRHTPPLLTRIPHIARLKVENARQGFLSRADFEALQAHLTDPDVRDFVEWFWWTGMRPGDPTTHVGHAGPRDMDAAPRPEGREDR